MKKLTLLLAAISVLGFTSCGQKDQHIQQADFSGTYEIVSSNLGPYTHLDITKNEAVFYFDTKRDTMDVANISDIRWTYQFLDQDGRTQNTMTIQSAEYVTVTGYVISDQDTTWYSDIVLIDRL